MGEGGEIKPLTLVAVCGLLATLTAYIPSLATEYAQNRTSASSYVMIPGLNFTVASFVPDPEAPMYHMYILNGDSICIH